MNLYTAYASHFPSDDAVLLTDPQGLVYTYGDAQRQSARYAQALSQLGLRAGDRVSVQVEKSPENLWLFLGCLRGGYVYHPLNTAYTDDELMYFLTDAGTSLFVCDESRLAELSSVCDSLGVPHAYSLNGDGSGTLARLAERASVDFTPIECEGEELAALVYSSGTTGRPKGIMLSHENLRVNAATLVDLWGFTAADQLLHALPIFHVHGLFVAIGCVLMSGAGMRWLPRFDLENVFAELPHSTCMMGVPTFYTRLLADARLDRNSVAHMRLFISGSAPLLADTFEAFEERTGERILERYGMTETGMNTSNPLKGERKPGTVGLPLPGVAIRVCDAAGQPLPLGEVGELRVQGPNVFVGYWQMPDKTADDFTSDGYFRTGDQARIGDDGYVTIVGRAKDMVISGGLNVYPKEVELVIDSLAEVIESAVIGLPDPDFGERVAAVVVAQPDAALTLSDLKQSLSGQLAPFKLPKRLFLVDQLPRNAMGKVQKAALRERFSDPLDHGKK
ncbi:MAG: malonyl-CoA synthase [Pseudomonadota bacterium]